MWWDFVIGTLILVRIGRIKQHPKTGLFLRMVEIRQNHRFYKKKFQGRLNV